MNDIKEFPAGIHHENFRQDLLDLLGRYQADMTPIEALALASCAVGHILLMQDVNMYTMDELWETMQKNIVAGNQSGLAQLQARKTH